LLPRPTATTTGPEAEESGIAQPEDIEHFVEAGGLMSQPRRGPQSTMGESIPAGGFVGQLETLSRVGVDHGVIPDDIATSESVQADFAIRAFANHSLASVRYVLMIIQPTHLGQDFRQMPGRPARGIFF
jgi:hypothetical protein